MNQIGPNAVLQLVPVLDDVVGVDARHAFLAEVGIEPLPDGESMIDEALVVRLHQALRRQWPEDAAAMAERAGRGTGDYILTHRIPQPAKLTMRFLPVPIRARVLATAIARHAWTFAGSGRFRVRSHEPLCFEIADNPVVRGESADMPLCVWHAQVFERLYRALVSPDYRATETECCATGSPVCRFVLETR